jgi:hypothetical protein
VDPVQARERQRTPSHPTDSTPSTQGRSLPWRLVLAVAAGTLLNPLNSSMIAVALLDLGGAFHVEIATATWLVSGFYIGGAIGMPLMGRLADVFGARRGFMLGLLLVGVSSGLAPLAPGFGWLLGLRLVQAFGTSAAYPAGLAIGRRGRRAGDSTGCAAHRSDRAAPVADRRIGAAAGRLDAAAGFR